MFQESEKSVKLHVGYIERAIARDIADGNMFEFLRPILVQIWWGGYTRDFIVIRYSLVITKAKVREVRAAERAILPPKPTPNHPPRPKAIKACDS